MRTAALEFLAGVLLLQQCSVLPSGWLLAGLPAVLAGMWWHRWLRPPGWLALGFLWTLAWALPLSTLQLPAELQGADLVVTGWIASLPATEWRATRFEFTPASVSHDGHPIPLNGRLRLSWYDEPPPQLAVGDRWRFTVRLKRPRGFMNPGGFDYERWLFINGITATGYVRTEPVPVRLATAERYPVDRLRQSIAQRFAALLDGDPYRGILTGLAVGNRQAISDDQWQLLRRTGTGHLMAISGLHVGLVAGLVFWLARWLWTRLPGMALRWPAPKAAAVASLAGATGYALLAGLSLPTQRALVMLAVVLLALLRQRPALPSRLLSAALLAVLIVDPGAPLSAGFWLSFGAVAALLYALVGRYPRRGTLRHWISLQLVILLALAPITLRAFQTITPIAPLANLIAIPWAGLTLVPLSLLAALASLINDTLAAGLLAIASAAADFLWRVLRGLDALPIDQIVLPAPPLWTLLFALPGLALLLGPRGLPCRWLGLPLCLPLIFAPIPRPAPGTARFTLLDVGSGLAAVVQTADHVLVYDTGPWLGPGFNAGDAVLVPFLRQAGWSRIDRLIVSHADSQHTGGVRALLAAMPADRILTSSPHAVPIAGAEPCRAGQRWTWDGVRFEMLHPAPGAGLGGDDDSCVLRVEAGGRRLLLAGDLQADGLRALLPALKPVDILVAPHQGRRELPVPELLSATRPRYVLFATGYRNRWGYPRPATVSQYTATGANLLNTVDNGAIRFELRDDQPLRPIRYRQQARHYWHTP